MLHANKDIGVPGVKISFIRASGTGNTPGEVVTDAQGRWRQVGFSNDSVYRIKPLRFPGDSFTSSILTLSFPSGVVNVSNQNFRISFGEVTASGIVTTQSGRAVGAVTLLVGPVGGQSQRVQTDSQGRWAIRLPNTGTFRASPSLEFFTFNPAFRDFNPLSATDLNFKLPDTFGVAGALKSDTQGIASPVPNAIVSFELLSGNGARPASARSGADGVFRQTGFTTGCVYRVSVTHSSGRVCLTFDVNGERPAGRINCL